MRMNSRRMQKMMKQMGMNMSTIEAEEVVIKTPEKEIVIENPQVSKVKAMGQDTFQITGEITERERGGITEEDVKMVAEQAGVSEEEARKALEETGDIAEAVMKLKEK